MFRRAFKSYFTWSFFLQNIFKFLIGIKNVYRIFLKSCQYPALDIITLKDEKIEEGKEYNCREIGRLHKKICVKVEKAFMLNEIKYNQNKILFDVDIKVPFLNN